MTTISRRQLLLAGLVATAATACQVGSPTASAPAPSTTTPGPDPARLAARLRELVGEEPAKIGRRHREANGAAPDPQTLAASLPPLGADAAAALRAAARADFEVGHIVEVDGWRLAATDLTIALLIDSMSA